MQEPVESPSPRSRRGCITLVAAAVLVPLVVLAAVLGYQAWVLYGFTSPTAVPVPVREPAPGEVEAVQRRLADFERGEQGSPARLELRADDINDLIAGTPEGRRYARKVFVRIEGDALLADVSLPLRELKVEFLAGRWVNGTVALKVRPPVAKGKKTPSKPKSAPSMALGGHGLYVEALTVGGKRLPESLLSHLRDHDLLEVLPPDALPGLGRISKVEVKDGRIILER